MKKEPLSVSTFTNVVEQALKHFQNAQWLGQHSPLTSPYFLGQRLVAQANDATRRGQVLQGVLRELTDQIHGRHQDRHRTLLREYYFEGRPLDVVADLVGLGRNSFNLSRNEAINQLANLLITQINPALRLETPPQSGSLLERDKVSTQCLEKLRALKSVALTGGGGLGKTALGSLIVTQMNHPAFWFTVRPGLNDHLEGLLFALGYFLHTHQSSALWQELVASANKLKPDRMLGIARYTLEQVKPSPPLLCIDEFDLLNPAEHAQHTPLVKFLESLRGVAPLLFIGQRPIIEVDHFFSLDGLSFSAMRQLLHEAGLHWAETELAALYEHTQGNPRLLELVSALEENDTTPFELITALSHQPALEFLLGRMVQRLNDVERAVLLELTVYRRPAPAIHWDHRKLGGALRQLIAYHLVQSDHAGGVALLPAYRILLYQLLPDEKRSHLHEQAANVRASYGDYASVIYHLSYAGQAERAIYLWHEHRQTAINQGQAHMVLDLLRGLRIQPLSSLAREALELACAELERLTGSSTKALTDLQTTLWRTPILKIDANHLAGMLTNDLSEFTQAEKHFRQGLILAEKIIGTRLVHLRRGLAVRYLRERELDKAIIEAKYARYEVEQFQGELHIEIANYPIAEKHYQTALEIAEELDYLDGIARTSTHLALLYIYQERVEPLTIQLYKAAACYERLGSLVNLASLQINWAVAHNIAGEYEQALAASQDALQRLEALHYLPTEQQVLIFQAMSDAYLGLGELERATEYVRRTIELEDVVMLPYAYCTFGEILCQQHKFTEAIQFVRMALEMATQQENPHLAGYAWRIQGKIYLAQGQLSLADEALDQAIRLFEQIALPNEVAKAQRLLVK